MLSLQFLGAAGTVTGSKYLLRTEDRCILVDCGLFQGLKALKERNWNLFPVSFREIDAVLVTHAHLDHTGYLPRLCELGYRGKIFATPSTIDLLHILLPDSAHLQEEEAAYHRHKNGCCPAAKPLYTLQGAEQALHQMSPVNYGAALPLGDHLTAEFFPSGHILGSAFIRVTVKQDGKETVVLFTGDMGRYHSPIIKDPVRMLSADYVLLESTYGNRSHGGGSREEAILPAVEECVRRDGCLLIPAFTVGRTQEILYCIRELMDQKKIPSLPVYIDSPMAIDVSHLYETYHNEHDLDMETMEKEGRSPFHFPSLHYVRTVEESKALNKERGAMIIISANGMCTGGRIMHHMMHRLPDPDTVMLFVGFQAEGTHGRELLEGAKRITLFHEPVEVRATIMEAHSFSAHGDYEEILQWLNGFTTPPTTVFLVHGEPDATEALKGHIAERFSGWNVEVAKDMAVVDLSRSPAGLSRET